MMIVMVMTSPMMSSDPNLDFKVSIFFNIK